jgi:hypothetical protein
MSPFPDSLPDTLAMLGGELSPLPVAAHQFPALVRWQVFESAVRVPDPLFLFQWQPSPAAEIFPQRLPLLG